MNARHQPALLGGVLIGVLSALPFVNVGNCCCCLWVVLGGVLVAYLEQERQEGPVDVANVVRAGLLAGVIGAVVMSVLDGVFSAALSQVFTADRRQQLIEQVLDLIPNVPADLRDQMSHPPPAATMLAGRMASLFISALFFGLFSMLGALLGSAIFKKKTPPAPPVVEA
jgi:hypothetical protein